VHEHHKIAQLWSGIHPHEPERQPIKVRLAHRTIDLLFVYLLLLTQVESKVFHHLIAERISRAKHFICNETKLSFPC
jgi:hypothetical protein